MEEQILKAATEITVALIQRTTEIVPSAERAGQFGSEVFKAVYKAVKEATGVRSSRQPAVVG